MVPDVYKIPFSTIFVVFLVWYFINLVHHFTSFKTPKSADTIGGTNGTAATNGATVSNNRTYNHTSSFGYRAEEAHRTLLDGLYLLSIAVFLNVFMLGNKTAIDTLSLIAMFAVVFAGGSHFAGVRMAAKGLWVIFLLSILGLFITAFASRTPAWIASVGYPFGAHNN